MMTIKTEIRQAQKEDVPAIARIYNHAIRTSTATFDTNEKSLEDRLRWFAEHHARYPIIVALINGHVAGWGSISPYAERPGWRFTVENAVYVAEEFQNKGIGRSIMEELVGRAKKLGHRAIIAQVITENEASIRLHEKLGFETIGVLKSVGYKFNRWLDIALMEKVLF